MIEPHHSFPPEATVRSVGERALIDAIAAIVACEDPDVLVGIGDDCAVVRLREDLHEILTTDLLIEGTHFLRDSSTDYQLLGRRAATANISDIASMGAAPRYLLVSLGLRGDMRAVDALSTMVGMHREARRWGATVIGGDIAASPVMVINIALTGTRSKDAPSLPLRSRCEPGQNVFVSGTLGDSLAGLRLLTDAALERYRSTTYGARLLSHHLAPEPRVRLGMALAERQADLAMIDISDSLFNELHLLARASRVGFSIEVSRVPVSEELREFARTLGHELHHYALFSGEEYELLFTTHAEEEDLRGWLTEKGVAVPVHRIGVVCEGNRVEFLGDSGEKLLLDDATFRHF